MTIKEGITFHDGTPLDGAAVKFNIDACRASPLTAGAYTPIGTVEASGQDVIITTQGGPWVVLPAYFAGGSCGYMLSPQWLASLPDVPQRTEGGPVYDAEVAATPADGNPAAPVGLGAFVFESYTPGNGNVFRAVRNEDYWRGPNGITGENLPYLDAIEAVVAVDIDSRANGLRGGQFDIIHTANADTINQFLEDDSFETISTSRYGDTGYIMLNVAEGDTDPEGKNAASPLLNVHCRRALAYAIDQQRLADERGAGLVEPANGPFPKGSIGYVEDTGYPSYDPDAAVTEMDTCLSELGQDEHRVHVQHDERPVQRRDQHVDHLDVDRRLRRSGQGDDHAHRAGPVHRPRPRRCVQRRRLAQPQRPRSRPAAAVVAERFGVADRLPGPQLRPLQGRRHGRRARPRSRPTRTRPPARPPPRTSTASSVSRCTTCG